LLFKEYTYSVLIVSAAEQFTAQLEKMLPENEYYPVDTVKSVGAARRRLLEKSYDIVLINTPLPDEFGERLAIDIMENPHSSVLIFVRGDMYEDILSKVIDYGILTLSKPVSATMVNQSMKLIYATHERFRGYEKRTASLEEKMEEIRIVNKAKWALIDNLKMTEEEAHRYIEKQAMNERATKRKIAENIIKTYK
jgi:response regulator NasT